MIEEPRGLLSWLATLEPLPEPLPDAADDDPSPLDLPDARVDEPGA